MQIAFDLVLDDIHAFNVHYAATAELPRRNQRLVRIALTLTLASLLFALGMAIRAPIPFWIIGGLILLGWWATYPRRIEAIMRASTARLYRDGANVGMLGPHTVELGDEWLAEITPEREVKTRWRAVEKVVVTDVHVFLYVSGFAAVIVPIRAFRDDAQRTAFLERARSRAIRRADGTRAPADP